MINEAEKKYRNMSPKSMTDENRKAAFERVRVALLERLRSNDYACGCGRLLASGARACHA